MLNQCAESMDLNKNSACVLDCNQPVAKMTHSRDLVPAWA
jgi:hypothetical protein